jgi:hypothetical protein
MLIFLWFVIWKNIYKLFDDVIILMELDTF